MLEFRFKLFNETEGYHLIDEPVGWKDTDFTLRRDKKYHSVLFEYSTRLQFYGKDGQYDGGKSFIKKVEYEQGIDAEIILICDISHHNSDFEEVFRGKLNLEDLTETELYIETNTQQISLIEVFNKRVGVKVDFSKNQSIDGLTVNQFNPDVVKLHSKVIKKQFLGDYDGEGLRENIYPVIINVPGGILLDFIYRPKKAYLSLGFNNTKYTEINKILGTGTGFSETEPFALFQAEDNGVFDIELHLNMTAGSYGIDIPAGFVVDCGGFDNVAAKNWRIEVFFEVRDIDGGIKTKESLFVATQGGCNVNFSVTEVGNILIDYSLDNYSISIGDKLFIYGEFYTDANYYQKLTQYNLTIEHRAFIEADSYLNITALTTFPESNAPVFKMHEAFNCITDSIIGKKNAFYSDYFGSTNTQFREYNLNGCGYNLSVTNGFLIRGFPWSDRPIQLSWDELYNSNDAISNLGMGIEVIDGEEVIRVERKTYFYDKEVLLYFDFVADIKRSNEKDKYFNKIEVGYDKWESESINGLDEFNTKHEYVTRLKTVGRELLIKSTLIAAGSAIELTRRNRFNESVTTDFKLDNDNFVISLNPATPTQAERDEYIDATGVLSPETSYNLRITPKRNLLRWGNYINGCLLKYPGSLYKFTYGEGNYKMVTDWDNVSVNQCPGNYDFKPLAENEDINWVYADNQDVEPLWEPVIYEFEYPLSFGDFLKIKDNKNKAIAISDTDSNFIAVWIMELKYKPTTALGSFTCLKVNTLPFNYIPDDMPQLLLQDDSDFLLENGELLYI